MTVAVRRLTVALALWALGLPGAQAQGASSMPLAASVNAEACGAAMDARLRRTVSSRHHQIAFVLLPAPAVGRHFGLDIVVCPRAGASLPLALRVDADMPAHGHGMNYRPTVRVLGDGRYRADGLMFHMAGRWRLTFDVSADGRLDRLSQEIVLE